MRNGYGCLILWDCECYDEAYVVDRVGEFSSVMESELQVEKFIGTQPVAVGGD